MDGQIQDTTLVGYYHFSSKDKQSHYFVIQCLFTENDISRNIMRGTIINVFTDENTYDEIVNTLSVGNVVKVEIKPNISTGKVSYKVVL